MIRRSHRHRTGRIFWWVSGFLVLVLLGIGGYYVYYRYLQPDERNESEEERLRKLSWQQTKRSQSTDWPQWLGPYRDGSTSDENLLAEWPADLMTSRKVWEADIGTGYSTVSIANGRAVTMFTENNEEVVRVWDAKTGAHLWDHRYEGKFQSSEGSGPRGTPALEGDLAYTIGGTGIMYCLDLAKKAVVWQLDLLTEFKAKNMHWGFSCSPLIEGDMVFVHPGGPNGNSIVALDKKTGAVRWHSLDDSAGYSSPVISNAGGERQAIFLTGKALVSLKPETGELNWRYKWETQYDCNIATPVVFADYIFVAAGYNHGCALVRVEKDGESLKVHRVYEARRAMRAHMATPVFFNGHFYGFDDDQLTCMKYVYEAKEKIEPLWKEDKFNKGNLLLVDNRLIVLGQNGNLALAEASPDGYKEKSHVQAFEVERGERCWSMPVLAQGRLYLRGPKKLICLDLRKERE